jgi:aldehyde:ferredoxin oxidoreductase
MTHLLEVDLTRGATGMREAAPEHALLGGHGLTSALVAEEVDPKADPLGPDNVLVFAPGLLAGSSVPNSGRLSVGAKSPLTGGIKEANSGGAAARRLAQLGIKGLVVRGQAAELSLLEIGPEGSKVVPAGDLEGLGTYDTVARLREKYGDSIAVICAGPAGEAQLKASAIVVTTPDFRPRTASRGGLGAVMGSKKLKAVVVKESGKIRQAADPEGLKAAVQALSEGIKQHPAMGALEALGTPFLVNVANSVGCLATKNFSTGQFESAEAISGENMVEILGSRPNSKNSHRCMTGCVVACSQVYTDADGKEVTSGFEFETLGLLGSNCQISDLDLLARIDRLCDDLGLDTMEIGAALAVAMEGGMLAWGDGEAAYALLQEVPKGTERARLIANGCVETGKSLGVARIPAVKGQGIAAWEPRVLKGTGVTYATSPQGADHTAGNALPSPTMPEYNPSAPEGQAQMSQFLQAYFATIDNLGFCLFPSLALLDIPELQGRLVQATAAFTGLEVPEDFLVSSGTAIVQLEREYNRRVGFTAADDRLPAFMTQEPLSPSGNTFDVSEQDLDGIFSPVVA